MKTSPSPLSDDTARSRASADDWLAAARDILIARGVDHVRIVTLADKLGVSRSSFYWFWRDRAALLSALIDVWRQSNRQEILRQAAAPADDIASAVLNLFECWTAHSKFDPRLDFAMREWSRRDVGLQRTLREEDAACVAAIAGMYQRYGFAEADAFVRARIVYFTQIGYYAVEPGDTETERAALTNDYLRAFTGRSASAAQIAAYHARVLADPPEFPSGADMPQHNALPMLDNGRFKG